MLYNNIRIYITEACNAKCINCFNRENRNNQYMDVIRFEKLCKYISQNGGSQIKIMGGEPTIHPDFGVFMKLSQQYFDVVSLFTNAMSKSLFDFIPRNNDIITYNFRFYRLLNKKSLLLEYPGIRNLEIQITPSVNKEIIMKEIERIVSISPDRIIPCLTLDCTANIFDDRNSIIPIYEYIWDKCVNLGYRINQDHLIPLCFLAGTKIPMPKTGTNCTLTCAGLIDSNFNLRFCNQYSDNLINIFTSDGNIIENDAFHQILTEKHSQLSRIIKEKGCKSCSMYDLYCNGGCFIGKPVIKYVSPRF